MKRVPCSRKNCSRVTQSRESSQIFSIFCLPNQKHLRCLSPLWLYRWMIPPCWSISPSTIPSLDHHNPCPFKHVICSSTSFIYLPPPHKKIGSWSLGSVQLRGFWEIIFLLVSVGECYDFGWWNLLGKERVEKESLPRIFFMCATSWTKSTFQRKGVHIIIHLPSDDVGQVQQY